MQPGDVITFNNRRMLHGRTSFTLSQGAKRHLQVSLTRSTRSPPFLASTPDTA
jgi:alpha-ketoglutarate-dependent taurine dioxygenase